MSIKRIFEGVWDEVAGHIQKEWAELTDDDLKKIKANQRVIYGILEEKYGYTAEESKSAVDQFISKLDRQEEIDEFKQHITDMTHRFLSNLSKTSSKYTKKGEEEVIKSMQSNPLVTTGAALVVGFILGVWIARK